MNRKLRRSSPEILLVGDAALLPPLGRTLLDSRHWSVTNASGLHDAILALCEPIDGAIIQAELPDGEGFDLIGPARELHAHLPILVVAVTVTPATANQAHLLDVGLVCAPCDENVIHFVRDAIERRARCVRTWVADFADAFHFTPAQTLLIEAALESTVHKHLADRLNLKVTTVRTQVREILAKTGEGSLEEVVAPRRAGLLWKV